MDCKVITTGLFEGIQQEDIEKVLRCLNSEMKKYSKGQQLVSEGDKITRIGMILSGNVMAYKYNQIGEISQVYMLKEGETFGHEEVYSLEGTARGTYFAQSAVEVLYIEGKRLLEPGAQNCKYRVQINMNMLRHFAKMNDIYREMIELRSVKSLKRRVCLFLYHQLQIHHQKTFYICQNREEMAVYLGATRPAVSNTLKQLKEEGVIDFYKNSFSIRDRKRLLEILASDNSR